MRELRCSQLPALEACPSYVSDGKASDAADLGTAVHKALAARLRGEELPDLSDEAEMLVERGMKAWEAVKEQFPDPEVEREFACSFCNATLKGHPDVASCFCAVLDWKTGWKERDYSLQLWAYAYLVGAEKAVVVWLHDTRTPFEVLDVPAGKEIVAAIDKIVAREGERTPCEFCAWCKDFSTCPERGAADSYAVQTFEGAIGEMLSDADFAKLEPLYAGVKRAMKAYGEARHRRVEHGPVDLGDGTELRIAEVPRSTIEAGAAWKSIYTRLGQEGMASCIKVIKKAAEKGIRAKAERGKKSAAVTEFYRELRSLGALIDLDPTKKVVRVKKEVTDEQPASAGPEGAGVAGREEGSA